MDRLGMMITVMGTIAPMVALHAQPVLTAANGPAPGHTIAMAVVMDLPELNSGPNCLWDFTSTTQVLTTEVELVAPGTASGGTSFPSATVAAMANGNPNVNFLKLGPNGLETVGVYNGQTITYSDPLKTLVYPCTFQTTWADTYQTNTDQGSRSYLADAYGDLVCAAGTVEGVLRVRSVFLSSATVVGGVQHVDSIISDTYWSPAFPWPVATTTNVRSYANGQLTQEQHGGSVIAEFPSAVQETTTRHAIIVAPNPTSEMVKLTSSHGLEEVQVLDATGRVVLHVPVAGRSLVELPLLGLGSGGYMIRARDNRGFWHVEKLVKR